MSVEQKNRQNLLAVNLSLAANVSLAVLKTLVGYLGSSPALLADGIMSASDSVYLVVVRFFMGQAHKPPDREHPLGHHQLESIAALVVGAFVVTTGLAIFWNAVRSVYQIAVGELVFPGAATVAAWTAAVSLAVKVALTVYTSAVGRRTGSLAVMALARDHRTDIYSVATALVGIVCGRAGYGWVDPLAASAVALIILYTGFGILRDSARDLMDVLPSRSLVARLRQQIGGVAGVEDVESVRVHCIGPYMLVDVTIGIEGTLTVAEGDRIATRVEETLWNELEYARDVSVHFHPTRRRPEAHPAGS